MKIRAMYRQLVVVAAAITTVWGSTAMAGGTPSVARQWNEASLHSIRLDFARPTVHARNLFHVSVAMWDAWAAYHPTAQGYFTTEKHLSVGNIPLRCRESISYAAYRVLVARFAESPNALETRVALDQLMLQLGYSTQNKTTVGNSAAAVGNRIAINVLAHGFNDNANEQGGYANLVYEAFNPPLVPTQPGNPDIISPWKWQPLALDVTIDQSGNVIINGFPGALSPEWGQVTPFALAPQDLNIYSVGNYDWWVYHDPGPPPLINTATDALYKSGFEQVLEFSSKLDPASGVMIDISPASRGNSTLGTNDGNGHKLNPATGQPYAPQIVPEGDYFRVLAEFWADGPSSETPPGHWFTIANYVSDHPDFVKRLGGTGPVLDDLQWDVKMYLALGGTMHDAAIAAWGVKGYYDYIRPISAIRYMCDKGQCTDPKQLSFHTEGINLNPGLIEVVTNASSLPGQRHAHLRGPGGANIGKIAVRAWRGPDFVSDPDTDTAGVDWILAENWWPYQRPSFVTPPFPGYVSGHSTFSRAAAELMTLLTGSEFFPGGLGEFHAPINEFLVFEEGPSVDMTLQWAKYTDASDECSISRIYGGIHPTADDIPGRIMGSQIGPDAFDYALTFFGTVTACPADCEPPGGNSVVNIDDLLAVISALASQDLNCDVAPDNGDGTFGNGVVNLDDLLAVVAAFGSCPH